MDDKTLLRIALVCSLLGIFILYLVSDNINVDERSISKINKDNVDEYVKIKGKVSKITDLEKVMFIEVIQPSSMTVVVFKEENISLNEDDYIEVIGKTEDYEGEMEVIAHRVRVI